MSRRILPESVSHRNVEYPRFRPSARSVSVAPPASRIPCLNLFPGERGRFDGWRAIPCVMIHNGPPERFQVTSDLGRWDSLQRRHGTADPIPEVTEIDWNVPVARLKLRHQLPGPCLHILLRQVGRSLQRVGQLSQRTFLEFVNRRQRRILGRRAAVGLRRPRIRIC